MKTPSDFTEYRQSIDTLDRAIVGLTAKINATTSELLVLVRQFDERGGWLRHSFTNCAEWLASSGRTSSADACQVVVHVDRSALTEGTGRSDLPVETVKRLMCDGSVVPMFEMATVHKVVGAASLPRFFQR